MINNTDSIKNYLFKRNRTFSKTPMPTISNETNADNKNRGCKNG